jgi:fructose-bisphosphate aldolase, class II
VTLSNARELVATAVGSGRAVPAFNVITLEHAEAIVLGAEQAGTGVLLQVSENAVSYHGGSIEPLAAACRELARTSGVPVGIHLDHFETADLVTHAISIAEDFGIGSIMFDASRNDYDDNVEATRTIAAAAHARKLWVEAELGAVGGKDGAHAPGVRTDPDEARAFVAATGVDALAVAVGSSHAMTDRTAQLDTDLIRALARAVDVPLVLHGSSGVPDEGIAEAVRAGIRKVNVGTALNVAWSESLREALAAEPSAVDPRRYFAPARAAMTEVVAHLCEVVAG